MAYPFWTCVSLGVQLAIMENSQLQEKTVSYNEKQSATMESSQLQGKQSVAMESSQLQWKTVSYNEKQLATIEDILLNVFTEKAEARVRVRVRVRVRFLEVSNEVSSQGRLLPNPVPYYVGGGGTPFTMGSASNHDRPNRIHWIQTGVGFPVLLVWWEGAEERRSLGGVAVAPLSSSLPPPLKGREGQRSVAARGYGWSLCWGWWTWRGCVTAWIGGWGLVGALFVCHNVPSVMICCLLATWDRLLVVGGWKGALLLPKAVP